MDGIVAPVIRNIYTFSGSVLCSVFSKQDTISWEIEPTLSDKKIVKEASEYAATMPVNYLLPHWREVSRFYFDGGNVRMRDAGVYVRENNWIVHLSCGSRYTIRVKGAKNACSL